MVKTGNENEVQYKRNFLEVSGYWFWVLEATEGFQGLYLALGRMTYSHLPNRIFI